MSMVVLHEDGPRAGGWLQQLTEVRGRDYGSRCFLGSLLGTFGASSSPHDGPSSIARLLTWPLWGPNCTEVGTSRPF